MTGTFARPPSCLRNNALVGQEQRRPVAVEQAAGRASEDELLQARAAEGAGHQEVGADVARRPQQQRGGVVARAVQHLGLGLDAPLGQELDQAPSAKLRDEALGAPATTTLAAFCSSGSEVRMARLASLPPSQATITVPPTFSPGRAITTGLCSSAIICWNDSASGPRRARRCCRTRSRPTAGPPWPARPRPAIPG